MKFSLVLCVLLGVTAVVSGSGAMFGDMMKAATDTMKQAMGAMGGGDNPFMKVMEEGKKVFEGGGSDAMKQMQAMLEKGMKDATDGGLQEKFQEAMQKMQEMAQSAASPEEVMKVINQMTQQG